MPKVGIIYNDAKPAAVRAAEFLGESLTPQGWDVFQSPGWGGMLGYARPHSSVCLSPMAHLAPPGFDAEMQFAVILGGDGTVLAAARQLAPHGIPLLTVNTGHLGFLTETYLTGMTRAVEAAMVGNYRLDERSMLVVQVWRDDELIWEALALNEMAIHREPLTSMCHFEITIGEHSMVDVAADGVILATPTGSTAYALSAGGPVVTPEVSVFELIPICPHSLASRALVFADREAVTLKSPLKDQLVLVVDGNAGCYISPGDAVRVHKAPYSTGLIRLDRYEFFRILREKMGWGLTHASKPTSVELP